MEFLDRLTNPEKYVIVPSRNLGEKDAEYLKRVRAFQQGYNEGLKVNKIEAIKDLCIERRGEIHWKVDAFIKEIEEILEG